MAGNGVNAMIQKLRMTTFILLAASITGPAFAQAPGADTYKGKCASCQWSRWSGCHAHGQSDESAVVQGAWND